LSAVSFRLQGPDALADAPERTGIAAAAFGHITTPEFTPEENGMRAIILPEFEAA
jgi:hypothetical protein